MKFMLLGGRFHFEQFDFKNQNFFWTDVSAAAGAIVENNLTSCGTGFAGEASGLAGLYALSASPSD